MMDLPLSTCFVLLALQGTLWDQVASTVPEDAQPPAPGMLSQHETLAKTLLLLTLVSQGVPTFPQDVLEDERLMRALTALHQVRRAFAGQLLPPEFETPRELNWHGASAGGLLLPQPACLTVICCLLYPAASLETDSLLLPM